MNINNIAEKIALPLQIVVMSVVAALALVSALSFIAFFLSVFDIESIASRTLPNISTFEWFASYLVTYFSASSLMKLYP